MTPVELVLSRLPDAKPSGNNWSARCPAHEDRTASLSVAEGEDGKALVKCHAGCTCEAICAALRLEPKDLMPPRSRGQRPLKSKDSGRIVAKYDYRDETGKVEFQVVRYEPKTFRQRRPDGKGGWNWSVTGVPKLPYRLPELIANPQAAVVVVEGEKDADALATRNYLTTCNPGGAGKWTAEHAQYLQGRRVVILPDNDEPGQQHARRVAESLKGIAQTIRIVNLPGLPPKGDVSDWLAAGGTPRELNELFRTAPDFAEAPWPSIDPLVNSNLPEFPTLALPEVLRTWVEAESIATQTPPDLAALLALAVCAACLAKRVEVEPRPQWREPVNLFVAVLLEPGNRKSAVFGDALRPLRELEAELATAANPEHARQESLRRQDEARLRKLEKDSVEKQGSEAAHARHEAEILATELAERPRSAIPRLIIDDSTSEKLGILLSEQGGRIASMSPEGGVFDLLRGMYSNSGMANFGAFLMGHSGDDLVTDRVGRPTVRVVRPSLTCAYAIQPTVIEGLAENAAFRGRGLLARFLYSAPTSWIGERQIAPPPVDLRIQEQYRQLVRQLHAVESGMVLQLSPEAELVLRDWEGVIEEMLGDGGLMEMLRDWGAKLAGATLRLAGILHCIDHPPTERMSPQTLHAAIAIAKYLIPHADAVLTEMEIVEKQPISDCRYVLRWIEKHQRTEFTKSEAQHHGKRRFPRADLIEAPLLELTRRNYIRPKGVKPTGPGRPPSPAYEVNPALFAAEKPRRRSRNSQNPPEGTAESHSGNNGSAPEGVEGTERVQVTL